jgi:hypothetical protein
MTNGQMTKSKITATPLEAPGMISAPIGQFGSSSV